MSKLAKGITSFMYTIIFIGFIYLIVYVKLSQYLQSTGIITQALSGIIVLLFGLPFAMFLSDKSISAIDSI